MQNLGTFNKQFSWHITHENTSYIDSISLGFLILDKVGSSAFLSEFTCTSYFCSTDILAASYGALLTSSAGYYYMSLGGYCMSRGETLRSSLTSSLLIGDRGLVRYRSVPLAELS